ncbi:FadR/GntR family transcriptional regulator [Ancylobacter pratisalsi]|uniref:FadR family transcriptional regulator n=1 Tax=Ancylobacter pratisalsi TaxID=1745854 RepID=A0A6P1YPB9_9HYPH|nr:FCD domain-containing protein [Ancylobacter pratisalsi]QIB33993.1 FadR family transcriptional regulator [Ancylobacter pratisalsi]
MDRVIIDRKPTLLVQEFLNGAINSGAYAPGAKLPTERAIAEELGVPRSSVRDVLSVLESQGRVVRIIGSGTYVAKAEPTTQASASPTAGDASPTEIMAARLIVEPRLAQLVVLNAKAADFERMEECNRHAEAADDFEAFEHWDAALHQAIAEATHNPLMVAIYGTITSAREFAEWGELKRLSITPERRDAYRLEHREIVAALRARDARLAEAALTRHLLRVRRNLLGE